MKKITNPIYVIIALILFNWNFAKATHVAGADITYENIGADSFLVTVNIFEDCGGLATVGTSIQVYFTNTCGLSDFNQSFTQTSVTEVSQLCPAEQPNSTCNGGSLPGMLQKVYQGIVVLGQCNSWKITWGVGNRNASVNLDPPGNTYYFAIDAQLNNSGAPQNNSPKFNAQPIPYVCANQVVNYSFGVSEIDGDSLVYSFTDPLGGTVTAPTILTYQPGYTTQQPLPGIIIDPNTGLLTFTPTTLGSFVVVVMVEEYQNGVLIGFVKRDIQFVVRSCANIPPELNAGQITNLTGNGVQTSPFSLEMCEGNSFTFTAQYNDLDIADTLTVISNIATVLPGSTLTTSGTNPLTVNISWTAPAGSSGQNNTFTVTVDDGACPIPGIQNFVYEIIVVPSTFIIPSSAVLCGPDSIQLQAIGGTDFTWYDLNGNPITPGIGFSCNNCPNPVIQPTTTTSYIVESNLSNTCINRDTIVVTIVPDFSIVASANDSLICAGQTIQFNAQATNAPAINTYSWAPAAIFSNPAISNPTSNTVNPSIIDAIVTATSPLGCVRKDTVTVQIVASPIANIQPYGPYCSSDPSVDLDYLNPNVNYIENWSGSGITNNQTGIFDPNVAGTGQHNILVTLSLAGSSCTSTDSITIIVAPNFSTTATSSDTVVCAGETVQLSVNASGASGYTYSWQPASLFNNPVIANPSATLNNAGAVTAIVTTTSAQGCSKIDTLSINVLVAPIINLQPYGPFCDNAATVDLNNNASNPNATENWTGSGITSNANGTFDPAAAGIGSHTITLTLSEPGNSCISVDSITINVLGTPDPTIQPTDSLFCSSDSIIQFTANTTGGVWSTNPPSLISANGNFNPNTAGIGVVSIIYSFSGTCPSSDTFTISVNQTPAAPVLTQNQINCEGVQMPSGSISASGVSGGTILWYLDASLDVFVNNGNNFNGVINSTGIVYAQDSLNGCLSQPASLQINFNPSPSASFTVDPSDGTGSTPLTAIFTNGSTGFDYFQWNFGDSSSVDTINQNASHTYTSGGIFRVILTVGNSFGCTDTVGFTILAIEETLIPNIFTPNADGENDEFYFRIDPNSISTFKAIIFDRWGKKVTEFANVKDRWDGGNYPAGTYYYIIEASDINNQPLKQTHGFFKMMK